MSTPDLETIETQEYLGALEELVDNPAFLRLLVAQYVLTRPGAPTPVVGRAQGQVANFNAGTHVWVHHTLEWMKTSRPQSYFTFLKELHAYEYRRSTDQQHRAEQQSEFAFDPGSGDGGAAG